MTLDWGLIRESLPDLLSGAAVTIEVWLLAVVLAVPLGFAVALGRRYGGPVLALPLAAVIAVLRGSPFLVQIYLLYFGGPYMGLDLEPTEAGLLGLSVYGAAYFAEIFRGGFDAVPRGHVEAAVTVGLSHGQIVRRILVPEIALLVLPACFNLVIVLLKETVVLSTVTVPEIMYAITDIGNKYYAFAESLLILALVYWGLVEAAGAIGRWVERRLARYRLAA